MFRIIDKRHHATPDPEEIATNLMRDLAYRALEMGYFFPRKWKTCRPGSFIQGLPPEQREKLKHLSSEHFSQSDLPGLPLVGDCWLETSGC